VGCLDDPLRVLVEQFEEVAFFREQFLEEHGCSGRRVIVVDRGRVYLPDPLTRCGI
jgi:hypothetical protein